jgi:hypothetical protein
MQPSAIATAIRGLCSALCDVHKGGASTVEKLITSVHEPARFVDRPVDKKIVGFSFLDSVAGHSARL